MRNFGATVCKMVHRMLMDHCPVCLSVCDVGVLWPNGWTNQDETWHADRPWPWPHCLRWRPSSPSHKGAQPPPMFGPFLLWPNGWMHQDATWYGGRPQPSGLCSMGTQPPSPKTGQSIFWPSSIADKQLHRSRCHLVWR